MQPSLLTGAAHSGHHATAQGAAVAEGPSALSRTLILSKYF